MPEAHETRAMLAMSTLPSKPALGLRALYSDSALTPSHLRILHDEYACYRCFEFCNTPPDLALKSMSSRYLFIGDKPMYCEVTMHDSVATAPF